MNDKVLHDCCKNPHACTNPRARNCLYKGSPSDTGKDFPVGWVRTSDIPKKEDTPPAKE